MNIAIWTFSACAVASILCRPRNVDTMGQPQQIHWIRGLVHRLVHVGEDHRCLHTPMIEHHGHS